MIVAICMTFNFYIVGEDFNQPVPLTVTLTSMTPSSGACSVINILPDSTEEGRETFNISMTSAQAVVAEGRGTAQVLIVDACSSLCSPDNGTVNVSSRTVGSIAMYSCNAGFLISGDPQRNCQADGRWSGQAPICILGKYMTMCVSFKMMYHIVLCNTPGSSAPIVLDQSHHL